VFSGIHLEHHRGVVPGLPHDGVGVGPLPENLVDEPAAQRMPTQLVDLGGGEPRGSGAARWIISLMPCPVIACCPKAPV